LSSPFEQLVIQNLSEIKNGQSELIESFDQHKTYVERKFTDLAVKQAEEAGIAKTKAKFWSIGGAAFTTLFAAGYETLKHYLNWK
jgi:hypothetical protein